MGQAKKGKREKLKAVINLASASGSGKTLSALFIAFGLMRKAYPELTDLEVWDKVGVVDTEHRRALYYVNNDVGGVAIPDESFWHYDLQAPYTADRYVAAIDSLKSSGCEVIIVDSTTHAWAKEGGLLELQQSFGGRYQDWAKVNPHERKFHESIFENDVHVITTTRTKQDYSLEKNEIDKLEVKKLGTKPIQRDDMEYEYMLVFNLDQNNSATVSKDNTGLFKGTSTRITPDVGMVLYDWLELGIDVKAEAEKKRQEILEYITKSMTKYDKVKDNIPDLEKKAKMNLADFTLALMERAKMLTDGWIAEEVAEKLEVGIAEDAVE